jgi:hypothetical protein
LKEISSDSLLFGFETFLRKSSTKQIVNLPDKKNSNSSINSFLNNLVKIEISTEFDTRERKFSKNFAFVIDQNDNPELLMEFDPLEAPIEFSIEWYNVNGNLPNFVQ